MEQLRQGYVERLIRTAEDLRSRDLELPRSRDSVREVAHRLAGSAGAYGFPALSRVARVAEEAPDDELPARLEQLLAEVDRLLARCPNP